MQRRLQTADMADSKEKQSVGRKKVKVHVCSSSYSSNVEGLIQYIRREMHDAVESVYFNQLPYNVCDLNRFDLSDIDVLLLCHSIDNRRFGLTNVTDSLYDTFLPRARKCLGVSKVGVIAHDFPESELTADKLTARMWSFRSVQKTTFESSSLVLIGGQLKEAPVKLTPDQIDQLKCFFRKAANPPTVEAVFVMLYKTWNLMTCGIFV